MSKKTTDILAYITIFGLLIALFCGDRRASRFHLNQSLVIWIIGILGGIVSFVPIVGWIVGVLSSLFVLVCWVVGLLGAIKGTENPIPIVGSIQLLR